MAFALALATILNTAAPGVASIVMMIRKTDGSVAIMPLLDEAEQSFASNIQSAKDWLSAHPKP